MSASIVGIFCSKPAPDSNTVHLFKAISNMSCLTSFKSCLTPRNSHQFTVRIKKRRREEEFGWWEGWGVVVGDGGRLGGGGGGGGRKKKNHHHVQHSAGCLERTRRSAAPSPADGAATDPARRAAGPRSSSSNCDSGTYSSSNCRNCCSSRSSWKCSSSSSSGHCNSSKSILPLKPIKMLYFPLFFELMRPFE